MAKLIISFFKQDLYLIGICGWHDSYYVAFMILDAWE